MAKRKTKEAGEVTPSGNSPRHEGSAEELAKPKGSPKTKRSTKATEGAAAGGNKETTSGYFRRIFKENPKLLKKGTNPEVLGRWLKDHPGKREVPKNVQAILHNLKSVLRKKRQQRGAEKGQTASAPVETTAKEPSPASRRASTGLAQLEGQIDDCLVRARGMDPEGLARVIEWLRRARNEVIRKAGMPGME